MYRRDPPWPYTEELDVVIRGNYDVLHSPQYRLFATRREHDFQLFSAMRRVYLQSKETKSIVMAYVEIRQPRACTIKRMKSPEGILSANDVRKASGASDTVCNFVGKHY